MIFSELTLISTESGIKVVYNRKDTTLRIPLSPLSSAPFHVHRWPIASVQRAIRLSDKQFCKTSSLKVLDRLSGLHTHPLTHLYARRGFELIYYKQIKRQKSQHSCAFSVVPYHACIGNLECVISMINKGMPIT